MWWVVEDIEDKKFFKCMCVVLCAVHPALHALRYCDSDEPIMNKLYFLTHRTTEALGKSKAKLDSWLFNDFLSDEELEEDFVAEVVGGESNLWRWQC